MVDCTHDCMGISVYLYGVLQETAMLKEALEATRKELKETISKLDVLNTVLKKESKDGLVLFCSASLDAQQGLIQEGAQGGKCPPKDSSRPPSISWHNITLNSI